MKGMVLLPNQGQSERANSNAYAARLLVISLLILSAHLLAGDAAAQTTTATIEGTVKDAQGGVVAGAQLTAKSKSLGVERTGSTDANGFYRITALPAGTYSLSD